MTTYFVAGYSQFSDGTRWNFWRVVNWTHKDSAQDFIRSILKELEDSTHNLRFIDGCAPAEKGDVLITAFNQV